MAAKLGDRVVAVDTHIVLVPSPGGPVASPVPSPFDGSLVESLCPTVFVDDKPVATLGSVALNSVPHIPSLGPFQRAPANRGTVKTASDTVSAGGRRICRVGDTVETCNDAGERGGVILGSCSVRVG